MKGENVIQDYIRFICAFIVIAIHCSPFSEKVWNSWFILGCRLAVPLFFILSGYYFSLTKPVNWFTKVVKMYLAWEIIYLPIIILKYYYLANDISGLDLFYKILIDFFFLGNYYHLWFFLGLCQAGFLAWLMLKKLNINYIVVLIIAFMLYLFGYVFNTFASYSFNIPVLGMIMARYSQIFESTYYNGIFMGFLFFIIGYLFRKGILYISYKKAICLVVFGAILVIIEETISQYMCPHGITEISLSMVSVVVGIFGISNSYSKYFKDTSSQWARSLRKLSTLIYGIHCWTVFVINIIFSELNNVDKYFIICSLSLILSVGIYWLSNKYKCFHLLKLLY